MVFTISNSIQNARKMIAHLRNDGLPASIGDIWSIKKVVLLDYYLPAFKMICSPKFNFDKWYYADPFCGSGLFSFKDKDLKSEIFPGSSLLGSFSAAKYGYTDCLLSDKKSILVQALNSRLQKSHIQLSRRNFSAMSHDFATAVTEILNRKKFGTAILAFIDPSGYTPIKWNLMEKLFKTVGIDVILNFMTYAIAQNASASKTNKTHEKNLTEFFGDDGWKQFVSPINPQKLGTKLLDSYLQKVRKVSNKNTIEIGVNIEGNKRLYDLIVITRSNAGTNVIKTAKSIMDN
jgi:three-Cys-motif partner protein